MTKSTILKILKKEQKYLKDTFGVKKLAIFGSFAHGHPTAKSDVDIYVEFNRPIGILFLNFSEYLTKKLNRKTDILTPAGIKTIRIKKIAQNIKRSLVSV